MGEAATGSPEAQARCRRADSGAQGPEETDAEWTEAAGTRFLGGDGVKGPEGKAASGLPEAQAKCRRADSGAQEPKEVMTERAGDDEGAAEAWKAIFKRPMHGKGGW